MDVPSLYVCGPFRCPCTVPIPVHATPAPYHTIPHFFASSFPSHSLTTLQRLVLCKNDNDQMSSEPSSSKLEENHSQSRPYLLRNPSRRVMTSFENLVVLANYQEALRDARKMVWRDRGEPATELHTLKQCLEHAGRGGLRTCTILLMSYWVSANVGDLQGRQSWVSH